MFMRIVTDRKVEQDTVSPGTIFDKEIFSPGTLFAHALGQNKGSEKPRRKFTKFKIESTTNILTQDTTFTLHNITQSGVRGDDIIPNAFVDLDPNMSTKLNISRSQLIMETLNLKKSKSVAITANVVERGETKVESKLKVIEFVEKEIGTIPERTYENFTNDLPTWGKPEWSGKSFVEILKSKKKIVEDLEHSVNRGKLTKRMIYDIFEERREENGKLHGMLDNNSPNYTQQDLLEMYVDMDSLVYGPFKYWRMSPLQYKILMRWNQGQAKILDFLADDIYGTEKVKTLLFIKKNTPKKWKEVVMKLQATAASYVCKREMARKEHVLDIKTKRKRCERIASITNMYVPIGNVIQKKRTNPILEELSEGCVQYPETNVDYNIKAIEQRTILWEDIVYLYGGYDVEQKITKTISVRSLRKYLDCVKNDYLEKRYKQYCKAYNIVEAQHHPFVGLPEWLYSFSNDTKNALEAFARFIRSPIDIVYGGLHLIGDYIQKVYQSIASIPTLSSMATSFGAWSKVALRVTLAAIILIVGVCVPGGDILAIVFTTILGIAKVMGTNIDTTTIAICAMASAALTVTKRTPHIQYNNTTNVKVEIERAQAQSFDLTTLSVMLSMAFSCLVCVYMPYDSAFKSFLDKCDKIPKAMRGVATLTTCFNDTVKSTLAGLYKRATGEDFVFDSAIPKEVEENYLEIKKLAVMGTYSTMCSDPSVCLEIERVYHVYLSLRARYSDNRVITTYMNTYSGTVVDLFKKAATANPRMNSERAKPTCVLFKGTTGVGKSALMYFLTAAILEHYGCLKDCDPSQKLKKINECIYARNGQQEFFDGYLNQLVTVIDDFGAIKDSQTNPNPDFNDLLRMVNNFPYPLPMASLAQKANTFFTSRFVFLTTNLEKMEPASMINPEALRSRVSFTYRIKVKREWQVNPDGLRPEDYRLDTFKTRAAFGNKTVVDVYEFTKEDIITGAIVRDKMTFHEMLADILHHRTSEEKFFLNKQESLMSFLDENKDQIGYANTTDVERVMQDFDITKAYSQSDDFDFQKFNDMFSQRDQQEREEEEKRREELLREAERYEREEYERRMKLSPEELNKEYEELLRKAEEKKIKDLDKKLNINKKVTFETEQDREIRRLKERIEEIQQTKLLLSTEPIPDKHLGEEDKETLSQLDILNALSIPSYEDTRVLNDNYFRDLYLHARDVKAFDIRGKHGQVPKMYLKREIADKYLRPWVFNNLNGNNDLIKNDYYEKLLQHPHASPSHFMDWELIGDMCTITPLRKAEEYRRHIYEYDSSYCTVEMISIFAEEYFGNQGVVFESKKQLCENFTSAEIILRWAQKNSKKFQGKNFSTYNLYKWFFPNSAVKTSDRDNYFPNEMDTTPPNKDQKMTSYILIVLSLVTVAAVACKAYDIYHTIRYDKPYFFQPQFPIVAESGRDKKNVVLGRYESGKDKRNIVKGRFESYSSIQAEEVSKMVRGNFRWLWLEGQQFASIVMIRGHYALINYHYVKMLEKIPDHKIVVTAPFHTQGTEVPVSCILSGHRLNRGGEENDLWVFQFTRNVNMGSDIIKHFHSRKEIGHVTSYNQYVLTIPRRDGWCNHITNLTNSQFKAIELNIPDDQPLAMSCQIYEFDARTSKGDCGGIYIADSDKLRSKVVGFHFAGNSSGGAMAIPLVREDFDFVKDVPSIAYPQGIELGETPKLIDLDGVLPIGTSVPVHNATKTSIEPTRVHNKIFETTMAPAKLGRLLEKDGAGMRGLQKVTPTVPYISDKEVTVARKDLDAKIMRGNRKVTRVLTFEEAVNGDVPENAAYIKGINRSTSAGYPYCLEHRHGKKEIFGNNEYVFGEEAQQIKKRLEEKIRRIEEEREYEQSIYVDTLKDETRTLEKVRQGKTRVFSAASLDLVILFRMYFMGFLNHIMENKILNEVCVGICAQSPEWNKLALNLLSKGNNIVAGDFSNYDGTLNPNILWAICDMANDYYRDGKDRIRNLIFEDIVHSIHIAEDSVYAWTHSQPSGNPGTAIINSIYNSLATRIVFNRLTLGTKFYRNFSKYVSMASYGDDNLISIHKDILDIFNQQTITEGFSQIGMTYTDETKQLTTRPYKKLEECSFLKRGFRRCDTLGVWVGPLAIPSVLERLNWQHKHPQPEDILLLNAQGAVAELAMHDKDVFERWSKRIQEVILQELLECIVVYEQDYYLVKMMDGEYPEMFPQLTFT